jgi:NAD(P)-dependent dehydrogenase (short-subunit alcohol dehydrogenase family)
MLSGINYKVQIMSRIFITGSADGLGKLAAKALVAQGHTVVLHARNEERGIEALREVPGAETVVAGDLSSLNETIQLASKVNALGLFDAVIHNAGVYYASANEFLTVNTLAPYILTCLIKRPKRLIYLSSDMHMQGQNRINDLQTDISRINYSDSKFYVVTLCMAVARKWPEVYANALEPGWVPTKMGGNGAPDDLQQGYETQVWLAGSNDPKVKVSGKYFFHQKEVRYNAESKEVGLQEKFLELCGKITGIAFPI